jgi:hypothetical protein
VRDAPRNAFLIVMGEKKTSDFRRSLKPFYQPEGGELRQFHWHHPVEDDWGLQFPLKAGTEVRNYGWRGMVIGGTSMLFSRCTSRIVTDSPPCGALSQAQCKAACGPSVGSFS